KRHGTEPHAIGPSAKPHVSARIGCGSRCRHHARLRGGHGRDPRRQEDRRGGERLRQLLGGADGHIRTLLLVSARRRDVDHARVPNAHAVQLRTIVQRSRTGESGGISGRSRRRHAMRSARTALAVAASVVVLSGAVVAQKASDTWRTYGGNLQGWRYSDLTQIDVQNVARLVPKWIYQIGMSRFETTPLVFDG